MDFNIPFVLGIAPIAFTVRVAWEDVGTTPKKTDPYN